MYPLFPKISRPRGAPPRLVCESVDAAESRNLLYRSCSPHQTARCCAPSHFSACWSPLRRRSRWANTAAGPDVANGFRIHRRVRLDHARPNALISCPMRGFVGAKNADATFPLICSRSSGAPPLPPSRCGTCRAPQLRSCGNDAPSAKVQLALCDERWPANVSVVTLCMEPSGHAPLSKPGTENPRCLRSACPSPTTVVICPLVDTEQRQSRGRERRHLRLFALSHFIRECKIHL